ncbi:Thymidylate synthase ThyX [Candidatus Electronema halotolerans]
MKVISPSFEILEHLDQQPLAVRIEFCGRVCYKSEDRITQESAIPFVEKMAGHGHNSVLEMGVVTLEINCTDESAIAEFFLCQPKYLHISHEGRSLLITGSIRAFREMLLVHPDCAVIRAACALLSERHPYFFRDILAEKGLTAVPGITVRKVPLAEIDQFSGQKLAKHRHLAVKFIVNRAVTHEIVRHRPCGFIQESQRYCRYSEDKFGNEITFIKPLFFAQESEEYAVWKQAMLDEEQRYFKLLETSTPQAARTVLPNSCKTEIIVYANLEEWRHIFKLRCSKAAEPSMREVMIPLHEECKQRFRNFFE